MVSDFIKKKLIHVLSSFFDSDRSGDLTKEDFELATKRVAQIRGWSDDHPELKKVRESNQKMWEEMKKLADADGDGKISQDEWVTYWDGLSKKAAAGEPQNHNSKLMFEIVDLAGDGRIDEDEYVAAFTVYGLTKEDASAAFKKASGGKGSLNYEEFDKLWKEFFESEDPEAPGNFMFGLL